MFSAFKTEAYAEAEYKSVFIQNKQVLLVVQETDFVNGFPGTDLSVLPSAVSCSNEE